MKSRSSQNKKAKRLFIKSLYNKTENQTFQKAKFSKKRLIIFAAAFAVVGSYALFRSFAAGATFYISTTGSDSNTCIQSAPCASFNRAYTVASSGDTVEVACGTYGYQKINRDNTKNTTQYVTFQPSAGQPNTCVNLTDRLQLGDSDGGQSARWVYLKNMSFHQGNLQTNPSNDYGLRFWKDADNIVIDGFRGGKVDISGSTNITIKNSELGNCYANTKNQCLNRVAGDLIGATFYQASNIIFDNNVIHDINSQGVLGECGDPNDTCHVDGIAVFSSGNPGVTISRNKIYKVGVAAIALQSQNGGTVSNVNIENNWIGRACRGLASGGICDLVALDVRTSVPNLKVRFNSFEGNGGINCTAGGFSCGTSSSRAQFTGNIMSVAGGQGGGL